MHKISYFFYHLLIIHTLQQIFSKLPKPKGLGIGQYLKIASRKLKHVKVNLNTLNLPTIPHIK